jgi:adenosylhomocysteinase
MNVLSMALTTTAPTQYDLAKSSSLLTLERLVSRTQAQTIPPMHSVLITHVLPTAERYIQLVNQIFPVKLVIAIPYSAHTASIENLIASGIPCHLPDSVDDIFLTSGKLIDEILTYNSTPLLVQEVGGYLAGCTHLLTKHPHFKGIVEDTNNGHWRYHEAGAHACPILSMAQSPLKGIEDTVIGDAVVFSIERIFREEFNAILQGCSCGVIGYGKIGTSTATALKGRKCHVEVYDIDPCKNIRARYEGRIITPLHLMLSTCNLIVGCTGKTSIKETDIPHIKHNSVLVSASAKDEEFDLEAFERVCTLEKINPIVWKYTKPNGNYFYVLNQGTPVNFRDRSVLGSILDLIYSELYVSMLEIAVGNPRKGIQHTPGHIHTTVAKTWLQIYEEEFQNNPKDKLWRYPESLDSAVTRTFRLQTQDRVKLD